MHYSIRRTAATTAMLATSLMAASSLLAQETPNTAEDASTRGTISLNDWDFNSGTVGAFAPIRASRSGNDWVLQPNATSPNNSYGWLQGPDLEIGPATDTLLGNLAALRVDYTVSGSSTFYPELRVRLNSSDFGQYAIAGVANSHFQQLSESGNGTVTVYFDRSQILEPTDFFVYIDLLSISGSDDIDPNVQIRITKTEFFNMISNSSYERENLISAAYVESDKDVVVYVGGSRDRIRIHRPDDDGSDVYMSYDGPFIIVLEDNKLFGYTTLDDFEEIEIKEDEVISAAISDHHVIWIEDDGDVYYFNFITRETQFMDRDTDYFLASSAGDGTLLVIRDEGGDEFLIYQMNTRMDGTPGLEQLFDTDEFFDIYTRSTGYQP